MHIITSLKSHHEDKIKENDMSLIQLHYNFNVINNILILQITVQGQVNI